MNGLFSLLHTRIITRNVDPFLSNATELLGFIDLSILTLGRQTPSPAIWYTYCRFKKGIEPLSGCPYSLLDLFSMIEDADIEDRLWSWSHHAPDPTTEQIWAMARLSAIISARERQSTPVSDAVGRGTRGPPPEARFRRSTEAIIHHILAEFVMIREEFRATNSCPCWTMVLFIIFTTASQVDYLTELHKQMINEVWAEIFSVDNDQIVPYYKRPWDLLQELWVDNDGKTANQLAYAKGIEICLF